jgi:hypothetical protein
MQWNLRLHLPAQQMGSSGPQNSVNFLTTLLRIWEFSPFSKNFWCDLVRFSAIYSRRRGITEPPVELLSNRLGESKDSFAEHKGWFSFSLARGAA